MKSRWAKFAGYSLAGVLLLLALLANGSFAAEDRLVIKNDSGSTVFNFDSDGAMKFNPDSTLPGILKSYSWESDRLDMGFDGSGGGNLECYSKNHASRPGQFKFIYGGAADMGKIVFTHYDGSNWVDMMWLDANGRLTMKDGAYCNGTTWVNASSRDYKTNIKELSTRDAMEALKELKPVTYSYKTDPEKKKVGFIAEDVPDIVATKDRKGVAAIDFVAVLTKVVQKQQNDIARLTKKIEELQRKVEKAE